MIENHRLFQELDDLHTIRQINIVGIVICVVLSNKHEHCVKVEAFIISSRQFYPQEQQKQASQPLERLTQRFL